MPRTPRTTLNRSQAATRRHAQRRLLTTPNAAPYPLEPLKRKVIHRKANDQA